MTKLKRGDLSRCGKKRFWQRIPSYSSGERWIPIEDWETFRNETYYKLKLYKAKK